MGRFGQADLYDAATGQVLAVGLDAHPPVPGVSDPRGPLNLVTFDSAGSQLAVVGYLTRTVVLWDVSDPTSPVLQAGPIPSADSVAFAGGLPVLVTQPGLKLWSRDTGRSYEVGTLGPDHAWFVGYSAATQSLITIADVVTAWDFGPGAWVEAACDIASRNLTESEWAIWVGGPYRQTCGG